jgi:hypothetical protein
MAVITSQISHGLYSLNNNLKALYMVYNIPIALLTCQKRFPKAFMAIIIICENRYPEY